MEAEFQPGDIVRIRRYTVGRMTQTPGPSQLQGSFAVVVKVNWRPMLRYAGSGLAPDYDLRILGSWEPLYSFAGWAESAYEELILTTKGNGTAVEGVDYQITPKEKLERAFSFYVERCMNLDVTHEGYPNPATFLARLYIDNDAELLEKVLALRRKNGTINPERLRLAFHNARMTTDGWAYEFRIDPPEGCEAWGMPLEAKQRLAVDWCLLAMIYGPKEKSK